MKPRAVIWLVVIMVVTAGIIWILTPSDDGAGTNTTNTTTNATNSMTNTNTVTNTNANTNAATSNTNVEATGDVTEINISSSGYSPSTITINAGDTVLWTNNSGSTAYPAPNDHPTHLKYAGDWDDDGTGRIDDSETYSYTFTKSGMYEFHDHLTPSWTGTIIVVE